jgi:integrase
MFEADEADRKFDIQHFSTHDLRRTVATRLADLGIQPHVIERILNHAAAGVAGVYNRSEYLPERKKALNAWGARIRGML